MELSPAAEALGALGLKAWWTLLSCSSSTLMRALTSVIKLRLWSLCSMAKFKQLRLPCAWLRPGSGRELQGSSRPALTGLHPWHSLASSGDGNSVSLEETE